MAAVVELTSYPIKGCAGMPVVREQGVFRTQRRDPKPATIRPAVSAGGQWLTLRAPGIDDLDLHVDPSGERREVESFGRPYLSNDQGDPAAAWLTHVLGHDSRLVRVPPEHHRVTTGRTPGTSGYADSTALLVLSRATSRTSGSPPRGEPPVPMNRFRPNIVVDGWDEPHTEDRTHRIRIGETELGYAKIATRCASTMVEQKTGRKAGPEPLRTLAGYRRAAQGGVAFGAKFSVLRPGRLAVGDLVDVTLWEPPEL